jgi:hypothetical protein
MYKEPPRKYAETSTSNTIRKITPPFKDPEPLEGPPGGGGFNNIFVMGNYTPSQVKQ